MGCELTPKIKVYDYDGYMQRELKVSPDLPAPSSLYTFDEDRLIAYFDPCLKNDYTANIGVYQYWLIDAHTGEATPIDIEIPDAVSSTLITHSGERARASSIPICPMLKSNNQVVISDYTYPIVYLQQGAQLKPLIRKSENNRSETHETMSVVKAITDRYILFYVVNKAIDKNKGEVSIEDDAEILYDRQTKEIYEVEFINPDNGKPLMFHWKDDLPHNTVVGVYHALVLDHHKEKGYLSGNLKEIAEHMDLEDNPVLAIITFK